MASCTTSIGSPFTQSIIHCPYNAGWGGGGGGGGQTKLSWSCPDFRVYIIASTVCMYTGLLSLSTAGDHTQYFPYLQESSTLTKERLSMLKENLYRETNRLKFKFASLMLKVRKDLEERLPVKDVKDVADILVFYDKNFAGVFHECTDFSSIILKLSDFVSFFDYDLLEQLINEFGSDAIKTELHKYKGDFQEFSKRRVIECPSNAFADRDSGSPEKVLVLVADKNIECLTLDELKKFKCRMNEIMGNKFVKVLSVKGGSICIAFEDRNFVISEKQQQALKREGVISITYGDRHYDIRTVSGNRIP